MVMYFPRKNECVRGGKCVCGAIIGAEESENDVRCLQSTAVAYAEFVLVVNTSTTRTCLALQRSQVNTYEYFARVNMRFDVDR